MTNALLSGAGAGAGASDQAVFVHNITSVHPSDRWTDE